VFRTLKYTSLTTNYIKIRNKNLTKVLAIGSIAARQRYLRLINRTIFSRNKRFRWFSARFKNNRTWLEIKKRARKKFGTMRIPVGRLWVLRRTFSSPIKKKIMLYLVKLI